MIFFATNGTNFHEFLFMHKRGEVGAVSDRCPLTPGPYFHWR